MRMISSHFDNETVMIIAVPEPEYRKSETIPGESFVDRFHLNKIFLFSVNGIILGIGLLNEEG